MRTGKQELAIRLQWKNSKKPIIRFPLIYVCPFVCKRYFTKFCFKSMCPIFIKYTLGYKFVCIINADMIKSILQT